MDLSIERPNGFPVPNGIIAHRMTMDVGLGKENINPNKPVAHAHKVKCEDPDNSKIKEKSLGILAFNFVRVIYREKMIAIEKAADLLSKNMEPNKFKTKVFSIDL
jgi:hypothetical protein